MGKGSSKAGGKGKTSVSFQPTVVGGSYNATKKMIDFATASSDEFRKLVPKYLSDEVNIDFEKYMGNNAGETYANKVELNGAHFKKLLKDGKYDEARGIVAHELTHLVQDRINDGLGLKGEDRDKHNEMLWNNAVANFVRANPKYTAKDVKKSVANQYGGSGHSRYGSRPEELMAVAVQVNARYGNDGSFTSEVGKYVLKEIAK